jgi:hypothetical protein
MTGKEADRDLSRNDSVFSFNKHQSVSHLLLQDCRKPSGSTWPQKAAQHVPYGRMQVDRETEKLSQNGSNKYRNDLRPAKLARKKGHLSSIRVSGHRSRFQILKRQSPGRGTDRMLEEQTDVRDAPVKDKSPEGKKELSTMQKNSVRNTFFTLF